MVYLSDGPTIRSDRRLLKQRRRIVTMMLYALPLLVLPLGMGTAMLMMSYHHADEVAKLDDIEAALSLLHERLIAGGPSLTLDQRKALTDSITDMSAQLQRARVAREWYATRPWAVAAMIVGIVLLVGWGVALTKLARTQRPFSS